MDQIENAAYVSIGRACGFAGLAVFCLLAGLSFDPVLAAETGGKACLIVTGVLIFKAMRAPYQPYARTELWLILPKGHKPPKNVAQKLISTTLRRTYVWFAQQAAVIAAILLVAAIVLQLAGVERFEFSSKKRAEAGPCTNATDCPRGHLQTSIAFRGGFSVRNP